jgi:hypothetical protein
VSLVALTIKPTTGLIAWPASLCPVAPAIACPCFPLTPAGPVVAVFWTIRTPAIPLIKLVAAEALRARTVAATRVAITLVKVGVTATKATHRAIPIIIIHVITTRPAQHAAGRVHT